MLALNSGSPLHRELIADILWGDLGTDSAVHALHVSVSSLRRAAPRIDGRRSRHPSSNASVRRTASAITDRHDCDLADFDDLLAEAAAAKLRRDAPTPPRTAFAAPSPGIPATCSRRTGRPNG